MKKIVIIVVLMLLSALVVWRVSQSVADAAPATRGSRPSVPVEVVMPERGEIRDRRLFTGTLLPRARYIVAPKIAGRLETLSLQIGDAVEPGQVLARLEDAEFTQQVEQARAALEVAQATVEQQVTALALAERELERVAVLRERGIASEAEWDAVEADTQTSGALLRVAQAQLRERESALRAAEVRLSYTLIRAPEMSVSDGKWVVEERFVDEGAMLAANTPMLAVVDIGRLTAVVQAIERDYAAMRAGLQAAIETDAFPGRSFTGEVARIAPVLREASRQARVEIDVANDPPMLRPGLFVRVGIEFGRREQALLAPLTALVARGGREGVFEVDREAGVARFVLVRIGIRTEDKFEILEPDAVGEVVNLGHHLLSDGAAVIICDPDDSKVASVTGAPRS